MFDPDVEEDREILDAVEEEEGEQTEDQHIQESQVETTAERTSALLEGRGASMAQTFGYEEAPEEKEVISDLQDEQDRNLAERQRARDEQQELEDLQLERLTAGVEASRRNLEQGRQPLIGYSNPNDAVRTHAESIGLSRTEFQRRVSTFGIGLDGILSDIAYNGTSSEDALRIAREYNPMMGTAQERQEYRESIRNRDSFMESFRERGQALPAYLSEDSYIFDSETSSFSGTQAGELETTARTGDASYVASELRVQGLLSDPEVARYVREYEASALGGEDYFDDRLTGLMEDFLEDNPNVNSDQRDAAFDRFGNQVMAELASLKTVGLWTMPIFLRRERIDASGWHYGVGDTSWLQALSPRIEVVGTHRRGRGRVTVLRQAGALDTLFRIADAPKSAIVGALTGRGARAGVAEGLQAMDAFGRAASESTFMGGVFNSSFGIATAQLMGITADVIFPDALVFGALLGKVTGRTVTLARVSREARGFTNDAERLLDAFNANNSEEFALIERQMAVKYPILTQRVDSAQSQMRELLKKANPDIIDRDLAARLPLRSGNLEINLSPDMRRSRTRLTGEVEEFTETAQTRRAEETLSQPLYTRGQNSTIDDFHYQRQVVLGDLDTVSSPSYDVWSGLAPQANRVTSSYRDEITKVLVNSADAGSSTIMANRISETLVDLIKNPRKWKDDTYEFVRDSVPGVGRDARMNAGERVEAFILRMQRSGTPLSAEEIVDVRRASSARKAIEEQLRFMANAVVGYRNKLKGEGLDPAQLVEEHTALLKRALEAVETNQQARIAAVYMVYSETHGWGSVLTKPLRLGKMRTDLIDSDLFADLDQFKELSEEAAFFASELRTVFTNIDRRQSIMLARLMDSRARTWAAKNERKVSEWWELNYGRVESAGDMRRALRARGRRDPDADPDVDTDADPDVDTDVDPDVGDDGSKPLGEVEEPIDEDAFVDAPEYQEPPRPSVENTVLAGTGRRLPTSKNKNLGSATSSERLDRESQGHSAEFLYDHLVEFDSRLNPNNGGARGALDWMSRHSRHPAARTLAERLKRIVPENEGFYIQDTLDGSSMLRPASRGRRADPGYGGVFGAPSGFFPIKSQSTGYRGGADSHAGAWRVDPYEGRPGHVVVPGTRPSSYDGGAALNDQYLLHEFLHSATVDIIRNPPTPAVKAVRDDLNALGQDILAYSKATEIRLLAKAKKKAKEIGGGLWQGVQGAELFLKKADQFTLRLSRRMQDDYVLGVTDGNYALELITYGLTNPSVQRFLKEMPMGETRSVIDGTEYVTKGLREGLREQSGFSRFVELISDLLSIFGKKFTKQETTVLHRVISVSDELLSSIERVKGAVKDDGITEITTEITSRYKKIENSRNVLNDLVLPLPEGEGGVWLTNILNTIKRGWDTRPSAEPASLKTAINRINEGLSRRNLRGTALRQEEEVFVEAADALISELTEALRANSFFKREMTEAGRTDALAYIESSLDDFVNELEALRDSARGGFLTSSEVPQFAVRNTPTSVALRSSRVEAPAPVRADIDTPEFRNWFGDSKVVDDAGEPLVVYHGTTGDFDAFNNPYAEDVAGGWSMFATESSYANQFTGGGTGSVMPVRLSIKNPLDLSALPPRRGDVRVKLERALTRAGIDVGSLDIPFERDLFQFINRRGFRAQLKAAAQEAGYDGIRFPDVYGAIESDTFVAFEPTQIKSVYNRGTFDPSDPRVQRVAAPPAAPAAPTAVPPTGPGLSMRMLNDIEDGRAVLRAFDDSETFVDLVQSIGQVIRRDMDAQELDEILIFLKGPPHKLDIDVRGANFIGPDAVRAEQVFARTFERYIRGGEDIAPSKGLQGVFYHCRVALGNIYAGIRADRDLGITVAPEIGAVLDRMLTDVPTAGKIKDFRRALIMNLRGVASGRFEGLGRAVKDTPIGINAELGAVSVAARISEELRRLTKPSDSDVSLLTEEEITTQIDNLIEQVSNPGSSLTGDSAKITFDVPVLSRIYGPQGKDTFSLNELVSLQSRLEAERAEALTETLPSAFEQARGAAIQELTPVEQLRNLVQDGGLKKAVLFTYFGGDPAALGKISLRGLPPLIRAEVNGGGRLIEESYGNIMRLLQEGDMTKVAEFLAGKSVGFAFGGRAALSSGYDSFAAVSRQLALAIDDIKITTANGTVLEGEDLIEQIERFFSLTHPQEATRSLYREKLPTVSLDEPLIAQAYNDTVRMLFSQMDPSKSTSFTRDVGSALGITNNPTGGQQLIFAEAMLYYMGITRRNGEKVTDGMPTGALVDKTAQDAMFAFQTQRVSDFLRETVNAYKSKPSARPTPDGISNRNRVALLLAGHGQVERVINNLHARGLVATEIDQINFKRWLNGEALSPRETIGAMNLMRKFGMNPRLGEDPLLEAGVYLPQAVRKRIANALARGMAPSKQSLRELGINASEQDIAGIIGGLIRYMKLRMTRGAMALRQRYFLMNTIDHMSQMAYKAGFRVALVSGTRVIAQNVMVLPAVARSLALVDLGKPGAMERFRKVLQKGGDKAARAVATMLRVSVYRVDLNDVLEGKEGFVRLGKRVYSNQQIREIMVEEGIFASFDTRALADVIKDDVTNTSTRFRGAYNVTLGMVTDVAEAWAERERAGAVLSLIEAGMSPRAACRVTIDALFDYAGTMSKTDRSWWMSLLFPFWAFQKNANTQVFNLTLSPAGAYRMGVVRRFLDGTPDYFGQLLAVQLSENPETGMPTPYGIYLGGLTQQQRELYYQVVRRLEFGYGEISEMLPEQLRQVLSSYGVNRVEDLSPEQIQIIENGFGPAYAMPEETRQAIRSLFAGAQGGRVVGGTYLRATGRMQDVISQTGLVETTPRNRNRTGPRARNPFDEFIRMTRQVAMPEMAGSDIRAYMQNRGRLPIPPVLNDLTRQYYETLRYYQNSRGQIESPYLELLLPDSTINAGYRHIANLSAAYILAIYGPLRWAMDVGSEFAETPMTLEDFNIEADPLSRGISPMTPFKEVLDIESAPIPGPVLEYITDERIGYPRRVHPIMASLVENFFPGYSVLRIDPTVGEQSDPYLETEAMTFANRAEYDEFVSSGNREVMIMQERVYMPPGISRFMFENSPLGELNRILMTMPTKVPFTDVGLREEAASSIDYRSMYEQVQDPEQLIQWARFLLGIDVKETSPTRTARIEEREIPDELQ